MILFMNRADIAGQGFPDGAMVEVRTEADDGIARCVGGLRVIAYDTLRGNCGGYYPELNPLPPLWHHDEQARTPAAKAIPVRIRAEAPAGGSEARS